MNAVIQVLLIIAYLSVYTTAAIFGFDANNQLYVGDGISGIFITCHGFGCRGWSWIVHPAISAKLFRIENCIHIQKYQFVHHSQTLRKKNEEYSKVKVIQINNGHDRKFEEVDIDYDQIDPQFKYRWKYAFVLEFDSLGKIYKNRVCNLKDSVFLAW